MSSNNMVKVVKNVVPKQGLVNHKKTKSSYVTAVAQTANAHGFGAQHQALVDQVQASGTFYAG